MRTINAQGIRYISEIPEIKESGLLPQGILAKKATDVGGTFAAMSSKYNYIIVVPFRDLVSSICEDTNNTNKVCPVMGGVSTLEIKRYIDTHTLHKFAVTYDSLPNLISILCNKGYKLSDYKVLVDEYHLILEDMGYRNDAIEGLMSRIKLFSHYTFMSATPINDTYLPKQLQELDYTDIDWGKQITIHPTRIKSSQVIKSTCNLIKKFNSGLFLDVNGVSTQVKELYIFFNSVKGIKEVIETCELTNDDVKVSCAPSWRNDSILDGIEVSSVTAPNKAINFFTKKGFQGCNLFSNNGLVVVVSNNKQKHTLVDVETTLFQIAGRLRTNKQYDNIFKNELWHIYSTKSWGEKTIEEFKAEVNAKKEETVNIMTLCNSTTDKLSKLALKKRLDIDDLYCYFNDTTLEMEYSELKEKYMEYNYNVTQNMYKNGLSIRQAYKDAGLVPGTQLFRGGLDKDIIIKSLVTVDFESMLKDYIALKEDNNDLEVIERIEKENPLFKEAYDILGVKGIGSCDYVESRIKERLYSKSALVIHSIYTEFLNNVGENSFISNKDAKELLQAIFIKYKVKGVSPTIARLQKECKWLEVTNEKRTIDGVRVNGIVINLVK